MTIQIYHVTNQPAEVAQPTWDYIKLCQPNDKYFDQALLNLPVACFSTTLRDGIPPNTSRYPRSGELNHYYWRVQKSISLEEYYIFYIGHKIHNSTTQIHLLLLEKINVGDSAVAKVLESAHLFTFSPEHRQTCFPDGHANESSSRNWVNVHFIRPVRIDGAAWDTALCQSAHPVASAPIHQLQQAWTALRDWLRGAVPTFGSIENFLSLPAPQEAPISQNIIALMNDGSSTTQLTSEEAIEDLTASFATQSNIHNVDDDASKQAKAPQKKKAASKKSEAKPKVLDDDEEGGSS